MKKLKFLFGKKGVISLYGVVVALILCIMLCGYMDLTQTTHVVEELQSIMDITALSTLQGSLDAEGVRFDRLTLRDYSYFLPDSTGVSQAERLSVNSSTDSAELLESLRADSDVLKDVTIWIDGTNAENVNDIAVEAILRKNFDYYLTKLLHTGTGVGKQPLFDYGHFDEEHIETQNYQSPSIIKRYEIREFDAGLVYANWGVDAEDYAASHATGLDVYQKIPQAYIATTIVLYLSVEPTFSSMNVNIEESHVYNALNSANSSSKLHVEGYTDDGLLAVSIRTLSRMTVQGFIASEDTASEADLGANFDSLPFTPEEYFDITDAGVVTGFSDAYYALPKEERPTTIKMPNTIRGITPVEIADNAFDESDNSDDIVLMVLPGSVQVIGKEAFKDAEHMKSFGFHGTPKLTTMEEGAFRGCMSLLSFSCPTGLTEIPAYAFYECTSLSTFSFNAGLTKIGASAFENCSRLKGELKLPGNLLTIDQNAFFKCASINKIYIPELLKNLGSGAFGRMASLSMIEKHAGNTNFEAIENVLYQKENDGTYALIVYPAQKKNPIYTIPLVKGKLVTRIADFAFYGNKHLDTLAYQSDDNTESPEMLHGIKSVGISAFNRCTELKTLNFAGDLVNESGIVVRYGLQTIGADAFNGTGLSLVYIDKLKDTVSGSPWGANTNQTAIRWKADDSFDWSQVYNYTEDGVILGFTDYGASLITEDPNFKLLIPSVINDPYFGAVTITAIGNNAFACDGSLSRYATANSKIKYMEFIANISSIGQNAFYGTRLEQFTLPDSVTTIGDRAFAKSSIVTFMINNTSEAITFGNYVFEGSPNLENVYLTPNIQTVGVGLFKDCLSLGSSNAGFDLSLVTWTELPAETFRGCITLKSVTLGNSITKIGDYSFAGCSVLEGASFTNQLTHVGKYAFSECNALSGLNFGTMIVEIGEDAFYKTPKLATVYLAVEEDFVPGQPWGAESFTDIIWKNSKWVKYYKYESASNGTWKIVGLSDIGKEVLNNKSLTNFQAPAIKDDAPVVGFYMNDAESKAALKNLTSMKVLGIQHANGYVIGDEAFKGCAMMTTFSMPASTKTIGASAFEGCKKLNSIAIPVTVTSLGASAFKDCSSMTEASVGAGVTVINADTFRNCASLGKLFMFGNFTDIGTHAFDGCTSLPTFHIKTSCKSIGDFAFMGCTKLGTVTSDIDAKLTKFNMSVFEGCTSLTSVEFPKAVTTVEQRAFYNCTSLKSLLRSDVSSLTTINDEAFMNTASLSIIPAFPQLTTIGTKSFYNTGATTLTAQPKLTTIGTSAFQNSLKLTTLESCSALTTISNYAFSGTALTKLEQPVLQTVGDGAFNSCSKLASINVTSLVKIGTNAFAGCTSLRSMTRSDTLTTIGANAFMNSAITELDLGKSIATVSATAFNAMNKLEDVYIWRPEYSDYQTNANRKLNVPNQNGDSVWGSQIGDAHVHWDNELRIKNTVIGTNTEVYDGKVKLDVTSKQGNLALDYLYNGNLDDLILQKDSICEMTKNNTRINLTFSDNTSEFKTWTVSDKYGKSASIRVDVDNTLELSSNNLSKTLTSSGASKNLGTLTISYSGDMGELRASLSGHTYPDGKIKIGAITASGSLSVTGGGRSNSATITVSGDDCSSVSCDASITHYLRVTPNETTVKWGKTGTFNISYSGDIDYLKCSTTANWVEIDKTHWTIKGDGKLKVTDKVVTKYASCEYIDYFDNPPTSFAVVGGLANATTLSATISNYWKYYGPSTSRNDFGYSYSSCNLEISACSFWPTDGGQTANKVTIVFDGASDCTIYNMYFYRKAGTKPQVTSGSATVTILNPT